MRLVLSARTFIVLAACGPWAAPALAQEPAAPPETLEQADARVKRLVPKVLEDVVQIRGLAKKHGVPAGAMSAPQMREWMETEIAAEYPASKFAEISRAYVAMGLLPAGTDMRTAMFDLLQDQVGGFYDPKKKRFYLIQAGSRGDGPTDQMVRMQDQLFRRFGLSNDHVVMAHELTHALQDQHFTLTGGLHELKHNDDRVLAAKCVVEGDATLLMQEYLFKYAPQMRALMQMAEAQGGDTGAGNPAMEKAPRALRVSLAYPYDGGKKFVQVGFKRGGWRAVDGLFQKFPQSTEQVLHPEKYYGAEPDTPVELIFDRPDGLDGWKVIEDNCVGELMTRVILQEGTVAQDVAERAAAGWDGDRYIVYAGEGEKTIAVWASEWDARSEAGDFAGAMRSVMQAAGASDIESSDSPQGAGSFGRMADGTGFLVQQRGTRVVVVRGASMEATARIAAGVFGSLRVDEIRMPEEKPAATPEAEPATAKRVTGAGFSFAHPGEGWVETPKLEDTGGPLKKFHPRREVAYEHRDAKRARIVVETRGADLEPTEAIAAALEGLREAGFELEDVRTEGRQTTFRVGRTRYVLIAGMVGDQLVTVLGRGPGGEQRTERWASVLNTCVAVAKSLRAER